MEFFPHAETMSEDWPAGKEHCAFIQWPSTGASFRNVLFYKTKLFNLDMI